MSDPNTPGNAHPTNNPGGDGVVVSGREAAQGRMSLRMPIVLGVAIVLVVAAFASIFGLHAGPFSAKPPGGSGQQGADSRAQAELFRAPPADTPKQNPPPQAVAASQGS